MDNVRFWIHTDKVWDSIMSNVELYSSPQVIIEYAFDDADKKWWISALVEPGAGIQITLESELYCGTVSCSSKESTEEAIETFLTTAEKLVQ